MSENQKRRIGRRDKCNGNFSNEIVGTLWYLRMNYKPTFRIKKEITICSVWMDFLWKLMKRLSIHQDWYWAAKHKNPGRNVHFLVTQRRNWASESYSDWIKGTMLEKRAGLKPDLSDSNFWVFSSSIEPTPSILSLTQKRKCGHVRRLMPAWI